MFLLSYALFWKICDLKKIYFLERWNSAAQATLPQGCELLLFAFLNFWLEGGGRPPRKINNLKAHLGPIGMCGQMGICQAGNRRKKKCSGSSILKNVIFNRLCQISDLSLRILQICDFVILR